MGTIFASDTVSNAGTRLAPGLLAVALVAAAVATGVSGVAAADAAPVGLADGGSHDCRVVSMRETSVSQRDSKRDTLWEIRPPLRGDVEKGKPPAETVARDSAAAAYVNVIGCDGDWFALAVLAPSIAVLVTDVGVLAGLLARLLSLLLVLLFAPRKRPESADAAAKKPEAGAASDGRQRSPRERRSSIRKRARGCVSSSSVSTAAATTWLPSL